MVWQRRYLQEFRYRYRWIRCVNLALNTWQVLRDLVYYLLWFTLFICYLKEKINFFKITTLEKKKKKLYFCFVQFSHKTKVECSTPPTKQKGLSAVGLCDTYAYLMLFYWNDLLYYTQFNEKFISLRTKNTIYTT